MKIETQTFTAWTESHNHLGERQVIRIFGSFKRSDIIRLLDKLDIPCGFTDPYRWKKSRNFPLDAKALAALEKSEGIRVGEYKHSLTLFIKRN